MIVHSYFTDGMYDWAVLFLESFKRHNGEIRPIVFSSRDISEEQIAELQAIYANLEVRNRRIDYQALSERSGETVADLRRMKQETEHGKFALLWKQFISVEDRYRDSIVDVMRDYDGSGHSHLMHIDIDMYFRDRIDPLEDLIEAHDISIMFRSETDEKFGQENRKVLGSVIGFRLGTESLAFMEGWRRHIDSLPLVEKPVGFGQTSFYRAYLDMKDRFDWGNIPPDYADPSRRPAAPIWAGNRGAKDSNLRLCQIDFRSGVPVPLNSHHNPRKGIQERLASILAQNRSGSFLEIGLGPKVRTERHRLIRDLGLSYTGLDFEAVCAMHAEALEAAGLRGPHLEFVPNSCGTYLYNLVRLKREGRGFDVIFLDGHHTLYTDMAAVFAVLPLLKPGSFFILDDVEFTLERKESDLKNSEFYKSIYDFSQYTAEEKREPHIGVILYEYLLTMFNFDIVQKFSSSAWVVLRVPKSGLALRPGTSIAANREGSLSSAS